jgi:hypothetical protein
MQDQITVTLEEEDFIDALRPPQRPKRLSTLLLLLALMLALLIVALLVRFPEARAALTRSPLVAGLTGAVILAASLVAALLIAAPALRRRAARSTLDDHPGMRDPIDYSFGPDGLGIRATYTQASYPWAQLWDWRETERVLIILPTPRNYYVIPKRGVDAAVLDRLRGYLAGARKRAGR